MTHANDDDLSSQYLTQQPGAVVVRGAHNPEVTRLKRVAAIINAVTVEIRFLIPKISMCTFPKESWGCTNYSIVSYIYVH